MIKIPVTAVIEPNALKDAGLPGRISWDGGTMVVELESGVTAEQIAAVQAFIASPSISNRKAASDKWALASAKLAVLPPVPGSGPDTYAAIRARLTACRDEARAEADALGGLI